jgi:hypothetical protein
MRIQIRPMKNSIRTGQFVIGNIQKQCKSLLVILTLLAIPKPILIPEASAQQRTPSSGLERNRRVPLQEMARIPMTISPWYKVPGNNDRGTAVIATGKGQLVMFGSGPPDSPLPLAERRPFDGEYDPVIEYFSEYSLVH